MLRWYPITPRAVEESPDRLLVAYQSAGEDGDGHGSAPPNPSIDALCAHVEAELAAAIPDATLTSAEGTIAPEHVLAERFEASYAELDGLAPVSILPPPRR